MFLDVPLQGFLITKGTLGFWGFQISILFHPTSDDPSQLTSFFCWGVCFFCSPVEWGVMIGICHDLTFYDGNYDGQIMANPYHKTPHPGERSQICWWSFLLQLRTMIYQHFMAQPPQSFGGVPKLGVPPGIIHVILGLSMQPARDPPCNRQACLFEVTGWPVWLLKGTIGMLDGTNIYLGKL